MIYKIFIRGSSTIEYIVFLAYITSVPVYNQSRISTCLFSFWQSLGWCEIWGLIWNHMLRTGFEKIK